MKHIFHHTLRLSMYLLAVSPLVFGCGEDASSTAEPLERNRTLGMENDGQPRLDSGVIIVATGDAAVGQTACEDGDQRACADECGTETCIDGMWNGICTASSEKCNGKDDDCDEAVDETFEDLGLGFACQLAMDNGCTANGVNICSANADGVVCAADPVEPSDEVCDGQDNDCDTRVDEGFTNQNCCTETAQCPLGQLCNNGICGDGGGSNPGGGTSCDSVLDCSGLEECISGQCLNICFDQSDCPTGTTCTCPPGNDCLFEVCLPNGSSGTGGCMRDSDCGANQTCLSGECRDLGNTCFDNADCPLGQECDLALSSCVETGNPGGGSGCMSDFDCGFGEVCQNGQCVDTGSGDICLDDSDCPTGEICLILVCVPDTGGTSGCTSDFDCGFNEICQNGQCIEPGVGSSNFCSAAQPLTSPTTFGIVSNGTEYVEASCGSFVDSGPDAVYRWQAPTTGTYVFDTEGSSFDTVLSVQSNCDGTGAEIDCDDDGAVEALKSELRLRATAGQTYYIIVSGYNTLEYGTFSLNYRLQGGCVNDSQCGVFERCESGICVDDTPVNQSFCADATIVPSSGRISGQTNIGRDLVMPSCAIFENTKDVIYRWQPLASGDYTIETEGNTNTLVAVFGTCSNQDDELACDDDSGQVVNGSVTISAQLGSVYYISVSAPTATIDGAFDLVITQEEDPGPECTVDFECPAGELCISGSCVASETPENNVCEHALYRAIYGPDYPMVEDGSLMEDVVDNCGNGTSTGGDADFRWFPIRSGNYTLYASAVSSGDNVSLALYTDCGSAPSGEELACVNTWSNADESLQVTVDVAENSAYRVVISGRGANSDGAVQLTIECDSGACAN